MFEWLVGRRPKRLYSQQLTVQDARKESAIKIRAARKYIVNTMNSTRYIMNHKYLLFIPKLFPLTENKVYIVSPSSNNEENKWVKGKGKLNKTQNTG